MNDINQMRHKLLHLTLACSVRV